MSASVRKLIFWSGIPLMLLGGMWLAIIRRPDDPYKFLKPGRLAYRAYDVGGSHSAKEYRSYTWKQPWKEVAAAAKKELSPLGMRSEPFAKPSRDEGLSWYLNEKREGRPSFEGTDFDLSIMILRGRSAPRASYIRPATDLDPDWVTVIVTQRAEETWFHVIRAAIFGIEDYR